MTWDGILGLEKAGEPYTLSAAHINLKVYLPKGKTHYFFHAFMGFLANEWLNKIIWNKTQHKRTFAWFLEGSGGDMMLGHDDSGFCFATKNY